MNAFNKRASAFVKDNGFFDLKVVRDSVNIVDIVGRHVTLKRGNGEHRARCPFHPDGNPSFVVVEKLQRFTCYGCMQDEWGDVIDFVRKLKGCDYREAAQYIVGDQVLEFCDADRARIRAEGEVRAKEADEKAEKNRRAALALWTTARQIGGTPAEAYLRGRGIASALPGHSLRYVPDLYCTETRSELPAMVAAIVDVNGSFMSLHSTWLARATDGGWRKAPLDRAKRMLGRMGGGAIRLAPPESVPLKPGATLYIAEGIETGLSVREGLRLRPDLRENAAVWAAGSLDNMSRLILPNAEGTDACLFGTVILCVDMDTSSSEAQAATAAANALSTYGARGCRVLVAAPMAGTDFNDMLQGKLPRTHASAAQDQAAE